jgi:hypothetical protein
MAEAKGNAPKKTAVNTSKTPPKTTETKPSISVSKTQAKDNVSNETFKELFETSRKTFMETVSKLTSYQKDFEKIISDFTGRGKKYQGDVLDVINSWYVTLKVVQEDISKLVKTSFSNYMPDNYNLPFGVEFEKLSRQVQDLFKQFYSNFPVLK